MWIQPNLQVKKMKSDSRRANKGVIKRITLPTLTTLKLQATPGQLVGALTTFPRLVSDLCLITPNISIFRFRYIPPHLGILWAKHILD